MSLKEKSSIEDDGSEGATIAIPGRAQAPNAAYAPTPNAASSPTPGTPAGTWSHTTPMSSLQGSSTLVGGRYEILRLVGVGGMGSVYQARDAELDEIVALKTLRKELLEDADMLERFRNEVKLARRVTHRNVARMFDIGEHGGEKFLTMEFVDGESLAAVLEREKRLPIARVVEIISAVCAGLSAAHAAGVIHRDLKPDNVMLSKDDRVLVTDFGIARAAQSQANRTMGMVLGTPAYMAPEQVLGQKDIDARADIYALGAMLFELFTGEDAWTGESAMGIATARLMGPPPDPRQRRPIPDAAARVILKCMARSRDDRYASTDQVARDLGALTMPVAAAPDMAETLVRQKPDAAKLASHDKTVAVLPFRNAGPPDDEYLAEGLTDDLIDTLSMTRGLRVCSRGAVGKYKGSAQDPRAVGSDLGVQVVVEGSVRKTPGAVRITARLVSVADGFQLWAKRFDRPDKDLFAINDEAARAIAEALTVDPTSPAREAPSNAAAVDLYLRARNEYHKFWPENVARAMEIFEQALGLAPNDPTILSGYALARARFSFFAGEAMDKAMAAARRAVEAAPQLPEARLALGTVLFQAGDNPGAVRELKIALANGPGHAEAHALMGRILSESGNTDDGMRHLEVALTLDPSMDLARRDLSRTLELLGSSEKALRVLDGLSHTVDDAGRTIHLARSLLWRRASDEAAKVLATMKETTGRFALTHRILTLIATNDKQLFLKDFDSREAMARAKGIGRRSVFFAQISAEIGAFVGDEVMVFEYMVAAVDAGLIDLLWFDRCALFEPYHHTMSWIAMRARLQARSSDIALAYRST
jgi:serine/threonine-protein kinase